MLVTLRCQCLFEESQAPASARVVKGLSAVNYGESSDSSIYADFSASFPFQSTLDVFNLRSSLSLGIFFLADTANGQLGSGKLEVIKRGLISAVAKINKRLEAAGAIKFELFPTKQTIVSGKLSEGSRRVVKHLLF